MPHMILLLKLRYPTWSIIKEPNVTPLYIVPQNMPTPKQHIMVAISVAYGTLAMHSLHRLPKTWKGYILYRELGYISHFTFNTRINYIAIVSAKYDSRSFLAIFIFNNGCVHIKELTTRLIVKVKSMNTLF